MLQTQRHLRSSSIIVLRPADLATNQRLLHPQIGKPDENLHSMCTGLPDSIPEQHCSFERRRSTHSTDSSHHPLDTQPSLGVLLSSRFKECLLQHTRSRFYQKSGAKKPGIFAIGQWRSYVRSPDWYRDSNLAQTWRVAGSAPKSKSYGGSTSLLRHPVILSLSYLVWKSCPGYSSRYYNTVSVPRH